MTFFLFTKTKFLKEHEKIDAECASQTDLIQVIKMKSQKMNDLLGIDDLFRLQEDKLAYLSQDKKAETCISKDFKREWKYFIGIYVVFLKVGV